MSNLTAIIRGKTNLSAMIRSKTDLTATMRGLTSMGGGEEIPSYIADNFAALWFKVDGTSMIDVLEKQDPLTLSVSQTTSYIPSDYAGTITAPDVAALKAADVNNVLYTALGVANDLSNADFIDTDLERIPVKYDDADPHNIRMIGLFDPTAYAALTLADKLKISNYLDLWVLYWGDYYDAGSISKDNRVWSD